MRERESAPSRQTEQFFKVSLVPWWRAERKQMRFWRVLEDSQLFTKLHQSGRASHSCIKVRNKQKNPSNPSRPLVWREYTHTHKYTVTL